MPRGAVEVADVFRRYGDAYRQQHGCSLSTAQRRVMTAIEQCRTAALGGHVEQCDTCGHQRISCNSCRNRHCPKCQALARAEWLEHRRSELLAVRNTNGEICMMIVEDNDNARRFIRQFQNHYQQQEAVKTLDAEARKVFPFRRIKHDPLFEPKKRSSILQLADFWAYVAKRIAMNSADRRYRRFYGPMDAQYRQAISATPRPSARARGG